MNWSWVLPRESAYTITESWGILG